MSILAQEFNCLHKVRGEEKSSHKGVTSVELQGQQINAFGLVSWLLAQEDLHLVSVVRRALELPRGDYECLQTADVCQD